MTHLPIHFYDEVVRFEDVDVAAIVYHPRYLSFIERARSQSLIDKGLSFRKFFDEGLGLVIADADMKFIRPLQLDDRFVVASQVNNYGKSVIKMTQVIARNKEDLACSELKSELRKIDSLCFFAHITLVVVSAQTKRPSAIPQWMIHMLENNA